MQSSFEARWRVSFVPIRAHRGGRRGSLRGHWGLTADQGRQTAQRLVDLSGGMKHRRHVGFEDDHIGAFRVTPRVFATHALREVVFGGHGGRGSRFA